MLYRTLLLLLVVSCSLHYLPIWIHGLSALPCTHSLKQTHTQTHTRTHIHASAFGHIQLMLIPRFWFGIRTNEQFPCNRRTPNSLIHIHMHAYTQTHTHTHTSDVSSLFNRSGAVVRNEPVSIKCAVIERR